MDTSNSLDSLKSFALPISAVVVVIAAIPLAIMPWFTEITTSWDKIQVESVRRDDLKVKADALEKFDVTESKKQLQEVVLPAIPAEIDPAGLLGTVEQIARLSGAALQGVSYSDAAAAVTSDAAVEAESMSFVTVSVSIEGSYEQIASFIARSQMISRVVTLDTLHIVKGEDGNPNVASFDIRSPYLPHPTKLALEAPFKVLTTTETAVIDHLNMFDDSDYAPTDISTIVGKNNPF